MSLSKGQSLGPYEILSQIGVGGMGEVYRARDTRLERTVAIKILPSELSSNSNLKQRFEREAKTISNLSHPHICTLHDVGHEDGMDYLVMEYLEGQTLAERLSKGPLPIEEVLRYALQTCEALDKAHRQGVVHRDLKPGNIMLTKHGVKLLDFGLAKLFNPSPVASRHPLPSDGRGQGEGLSGELTVKESLTEQGTILGTVQYMAPEQLEGKEADARTDIFAFGAVLYEMASGKKAFSGKSRASLMAAILEREPERLSQIAPLIPPTLDRVVDGCLAKDREERWQTAHDLKLQLKWILEGGSETGLQRAVAARRRNRELLAWGIASVMTLFAGFGLSVALRKDAHEPRPMRFQIDSPIGTSIHLVALSPSGRKLAMIARAINSRPQLWIQPLDSLLPKAVANTDGAAFPFWSPDERFVGFFADGALKKVDLDSGMVVSLCSARNGRGGTWSASGIILFAQGGSVPLHQVQGNGGIPAPVNMGEPQGQYGFPWFLPDGEHFVFWAGDELAEHSEGGIFLASIRSPNRARQILSEAGNAIYAAGHLIYFSNRKLMAAPFDAGSHKLIGHSFPVADAVQWQPYHVNTGVFSAAQDGSLVYLPGHGRTNSVQLTWYNPDGERLESVGQPGNFAVVHLSPDGRLATVDHLDTEIGRSDILIWDLQRKTPLKATSHPAHDRHAIWSPDGKWIVFCSNRNQVFDLFIKEVDSVRPEQPLFQSPDSKHARSWSSDGRYLLFDRAGLKTGTETWYLDMKQEPPKAEPLLSYGHNTYWARFSPDGKWIAYQSNEEKTMEVFVISFPELKGKRKISIGGGFAPGWSRDGSKIYYVDPETILTEVELDRNTNGLEPRQPRRLFRLSGPVSPFDVAPDGRILATIEVPTTNSAPLTVVLNWPLEFQKK
ncbi:MAG: protein kinase [Verrucomicrobia bacterium]|nr:protein kinase [Verrucomicrobiota bacterium]